MNPPKVRDEDYINFIIATPRTVTATEASACQPESRNAPSHDAFTRLLLRLEPDPETLWTEAQTQIDLNRGILVLDDSTIEKPYSPRNALLYRHWSGKQGRVVEGINLITWLWTDGVRCVPIDYGVFDKDRDGKTKNDHFADMLLAAFERGFNPELVCFDSWYASVENLKLVRAFGWYFLTRLKVEPPSPSRHGQTASRLGSRVVRRQRNNLLAQRIWRNQSLSGSRHRRHIGILGNEPSQDARGGAREIRSLSVAH